MLLSNFTVLYFVLSRYFGVKAFRMKPAVCETFTEQVIDWTMKEIVNKALNA